MKKISVILMSLICVSAFGAGTPVPPAPQPRVSLFSTSVDWAGVTGLSWRQYTGKITGKNKSLIKDGLVLYYLDAFPCYGEADSVRVWLSPNGKMVGNLRLVCVHAPEQISFAYHNATEEASQSRTTGIISCPVNGERNFTIDISKCTVGKNWAEYK